MDEFLRPFLSSPGSSVSSLSHLIPLWRSSPIIPYDAPTCSGCLGRFSAFLSSVNMSPFLNCTVSLSKCLLSSCCGFKGSFKVHVLATTSREKTSQRWQMPLLCCSLDTGEVGSSEKDGGDPPPPDGPQYLFFFTLLLWVGTTARLSPNVVPQLLEL